MASEGEGKTGRKRFYHIITDPWLVGPATLFSSWLAHIERTEPAAVSDGAGVDALVREIDRPTVLEALAAEAHGEAFHEVRDTQPRRPWLDAIFVKLHFIDHLHQPTLETFDKTIPVFAAAQAAPAVRGWSHFDTVVETKDYKRCVDSNTIQNKNSTSEVSPSKGIDHWKSFHPGRPLPEWLSVFRLTGDRDLELATAIVWSHEDQGSHDGSGTGHVKHEFIINTPHGVNVNTESVAAFFDDNVSHKSNTAEGSGGLPGHVGQLNCLAILAGLKDSYAFGYMRSTVGVERSLQLERRAEPRYWVRSHDAPLRYSGGIMRALMTTDFVRTLEYGLEEEKKQRMKEGKTDELRKPNLIHVRNGACLVLQ
ncbi:hypothetical protein diail_5262 [Diaporthe ilicicola]|nr:hypothetical protein diail_5262 [Diaporthe ilicicola]